MLDYETLKLIWWGLLVALILGFALSDGYDLGVAALLPFVARRDEERRVLLNVIGPHWEGHQVWFITAGGATFAAWPLVYAAAFSSLYTALLLILLALILRPVGFEFRSKLQSGYWRCLWDYGLFAAGLVPAVVFGVAVGNLFLGLPFAYDAELRLEYHGSFLQLLNPFALLVGATSLAMLVLHGACYLQLRTEGIIRQRCVKAATVAGPLLGILFLAAGIWLWHTPGPHLTHMGAPDQALSPLEKTVSLVMRGWFWNFDRVPWLRLLPSIGSVLPWLVPMASRRGWHNTSFLLSSTTLACVIFTAAAALFPFILPSSANPDQGLTAWDASSSRLTLEIMLIATVVLLPVVIGYTGWALRVMRGSVTEADIRAEHQHLY
jgi:cytochrome d ubiquinol oxidase subunit II